MIGGKQEARAISRVIGVSFRTNDDDGFIVFHHLTKHQSAQALRIDDKSRLK